MYAIASSFIEFAGNSIMQFAAFPVPPIMLVFDAISSYFSAILVIFGRHTILCSLFLVVTT